VAKTIKKSMKKLIIIFLLLVLFIPAITKAAGLVPCGGPEPEKPCTACDLLVLAENVLHYALTLAFTIVVIFAIIAGFRMILSGGNEVNIKAAQKSLSTALIGLAIILCSYLIVNTVFWLMAQIGGDDYTSDWWHLECTYPESKTDNDGDNGNGSREKNDEDIVYVDQYQYQYGSGCRNLSGYADYDCHLKSNCDFDPAKYMDVGNMDCPPEGGWTCCVAKEGAVDPPVPTPPPLNPTGCKDNASTVQCVYHLCKVSCASSHKLYCHTYSQYVCPEELKECQSQNQCDNPTNCGSTERCLLCQYQQYTTVNTGLGTCKKFYYYVPSTYGCSNYNLEAAEFIEQKEVNSKEECCTTGCDACNSKSGVEF
jgi:hypothetical protein